jgi:mannose-6-phosphate isomerase-like protein (cupin superfamily)
MRRVEKPWGYELIWAETEHYVAKILHINAGHSLSRQYHEHKEETFMVWFGEIALEIGHPVEEVFYMKGGDTYHCPPKTIHRMTAKVDTDVVEVSTPQLNDIVRLEDNYGR